MNIKGKKINAFGKSIPVIAIVLMVLTAGIAGAALVSVYFTTEGTVNVSAPLSVNPGIAGYAVDTAAGNTHKEILTVTNAAKVAIPANLVTTILCPDNIIINGPGNFATDGINVSYLDADGVPIIQPVAIMPKTTEITAHIETNSALEEGKYTITTTAEPVANRKALILENKNANWEVIDDNTFATLIYNPSGSNFNYALVGSGLKPDTSYSLIYYADYAGRFSNWGGNNPGALIDKGTTTTNGNLRMAGSEDLDMNLPCPPDANIDGVDYRVKDGYSNAHGAKIWLVPTDALPASFPSPDTASVAWETWPVSEILFETDLISYTRT